MISTVAQDPSSSSISRLTNAARFVPVLTVHEIGEVDSPWSLPPRTFARLIEWLAASGHTTLTMTELAAHHTGRRQAPPQAVALTFDDARAGLYRHARSILAAHEMAATIYPVAGWTRGVPLPAHEAYSAALSLDQLAELIDDGHEIGYHTDTHDCMRTRTDAEIITDLTDTRAGLEDELGVGIRHFAYPYGHHDTRVQALVDRHGRFDTIVTTARGRTPDLRRYPRISLKRTLRQAEFALLFEPDTWIPRAPVVCEHQADAPFQVDPAPPDDADA